LTPAFPPPEAEPAEFAPEAPPAEVHLSEYWAMIKKRRRLVALCVGVALVLGLGWSIKTKPMYKATVVLDVEKDKAGLLDAGTGERFLFDTAYLATQIQLMKSREIAERVVKKLKLLENREVNPTRSGLVAGSRDKPAPSAQDVTTSIAGRISGAVDVQPVPGTNILKLSYKARSAPLAAEAR